MSCVEMVGGVPFVGGGGAGRGRVDENWPFDGILVPSFSSSLAANLNPVEERRAQGCLPRKRALAGGTTELIRRQDEKRRVAPEVVLKASCIFLETIPTRSEDLKCSCAVAAAMVEHPSRYHVPGKR